MGLIRTIFIFHSIFFFGEGIFCHCNHDNMCKTFFYIILDIIFPILALSGLIGIFVMNKMNKEGAIFLSSATFIFGAILTTIMAMFPVLLPSTNSVNPSLTVQSMKAEDYSLEVVSSRKLKEGDKTSKDTIAVYGKINQKNTQSLLKINSYYNDTDEIKVNIYKNGQLISSHQAKAETNSENVRYFGDISIQ